MRAVEFVGLERNRGRYALVLELLNRVHELCGFRLAVAVEHARVIEIEERVLDA